MAGEPSPGREERPAYRVDELGLFAVPVDGSGDAIALTHPLVAGGSRGALSFIVF